MTNTEIKRNVRVKFVRENDGRFSIKKGKDVLVGPEEKFAYYFSGVDFSPKGIIIGTILGTEDGDSDSDRYDSVEYRDGGWYIEGTKRKVERARMVSIVNGDKPKILISIN